MLGFKNFLTEAKEDKNLHLEHLEDEVLNGGVSGTRGAITFLVSLRKMLSGDTERSVDITTKWDGSPALFAGINPENKRFFVGTKGVFAQNAKLNYSDEDIDTNYPEPSGLNRKLKCALRYLPDIGIRGVLQGDMLFTKGDLQKNTIDGVEYITFTPNTITYAVPSNTNLARLILAAQIGIVFHTTYTGKTMADMKASFGADVGHLRPNKNVWFRDASFTDVSGTATFTKAESEAISAVLSQIRALFRQIDSQVLNKISATETINTQIKIWNNLKVRAGEKISDTRSHVLGLIHFAEEKANRNILDAKKQDTKLKREKEKAILLGFYKKNAQQLKLIFDLQNLIVQAKEMILRKLEKVQDIGTFLRTDDGFKITSPEGFVAIDRIKGNAVKLVDRLTFSRANFNAPKNWKK